uniref:FBA_2 domain-containing protein n=1 Tax=Caenorhabditis tropicalis TaxID=1561998 RepID=A0A1I7UTP3_9PELO
MTCAIPNITIDFSENLFIQSGPNVFNDWQRVTKEVLGCLIAGELMRMSFCSNALLLRKESPHKQLLLANYLLDTFKKPSIYARFSETTLFATAWEFMRIINQRGLCTKMIYYYITSESSEFIPRILDECTEVTDLISIKATFPDDFVYTPSRPFKVAVLRISLTPTNWLNLQHFLSCREISVSFSMSSNRDPQLFNTFFRNWLDSDSPLKRFLYFQRDIAFAPIINGLSNEGINEGFNNEWIEVKRRDGSEFVIGRDLNYIYIMTKHNHLEHMWRQEQFDPDDFE